MPVPRLGRGLFGRSYTGTSMRSVCNSSKSVGLGFEPMMSTCVRPLDVVLEEIRKEENNVGLRYQPASWLI